MSGLLDELLSVYRRPDLLVNDAHTADARHAELINAGISRLARFNPAKARQALENARATQPFTDAQLQDMESLIVRHSLFAQSAAPEPWLIEILERLRDDDLTEIYLRNQVTEADWPAILGGLPWLSEGRRSDDKWRYWQARALLATGSEDRAQPLLEALATQRSYHGFLAALRLGQPYQLSPAAWNDRQPVSDPALGRVENCWPWTRPRRRDWNGVHSSLDWTTMTGSPPPNGPWLKAGSTMPSMRPTPPGPGMRSTCASPRPTGLFSLPTPRPKRWRSLNCWPLPGGRAPWTHWPDHRWVLWD